MPLQERREQKLTELCSLPLGSGPTPADSDQRTGDLQCIAQSLRRLVGDLSKVFENFEEPCHKARKTAQLGPYVPSTAASPTLSKPESDELEEGEIREPSYKKTCSEVSCRFVYNQRGE